MNLSASLALLFAAAVGTATLAISQDELLAIQEGATASLARTQSIYDTELVKAATIAWQLERGDFRQPSIDELVAAGYLAPEFKDRQKVGGAE